MADFQGYPIIDDSFRSDNVEHGKGYEGRDLDKYPRGGLKCARMVSKPKIDEKTVRELIKEKDEKKSWITDESDRRGRRRKNQASTNFCWGNAGCGGMELCILMEGGPLLDLSAAYACCGVNGGRNQGGSGISWVEWAHENGVCTSQFWQTNMVASPSRATADAKANAMKHKLELLNEFDPGDYDSINASIVMDEPVTVGIPAWSHEILITRLTIDSRGNIKRIFDNSWGDDWGNKGRGILDGRMDVFDEAAAIVAVSLSST